MKTILALLVILGCSFLANSKTLPNGVYFVQSVEYGSYWEACGEGCDTFYTEEPYLDHFQRFILTRLDNGYYTIVFEYNGRAVGYGEESPTSVKLAASLDSNAPEQQFKLVHRGGDNYLIKPRLHPSQALSPTGYNSEFILDDKDCFTSLQLFKFVPYQVTHARLLSREQRPRFKI